MVGSQGSWQTFQAATPGFLTNFFPSGAVTIGLVYSQDAAAFFLVVSVAGQLSMLRSSDGITWTLATPVPLAAFSPIGLAAVGSVLAVVTNDTGSGCYVIFSIDGGATWRRTQAFFPTFSTPLAYFPKIAASDIGLMVMNQAAARVGHYSGLPPALS
jgi:hypothetical protein